LEIKEDSASDMAFKNLNLVVLIIGLSRRKRERKAVFEKTYV
jgi:hypothetical protein